AVAAAHAAGGCPARRGLRTLRARAAPADRGAERSLPPALFHGSRRDTESCDALSARGVSLPARTVSSVASADGDRTVAARCAAVLLKPAPPRRTRRTRSQSGVFEFQLEASVSTVSSAVESLS